MEAVVLGREQARKLLVRHLHLHSTIGRGAAGTRKTLETLRCIQLDPLDVIGTNADLVVLSRVDGVMRGDVWSHLFPHHAFEHFAKERCILPADAFPWYREQGHAAAVGWWRHAEREKRIRPEQLQSVLQEIEQRGPVTSKDLTDHGRVDPLEWTGWRGTASATTMAIEILWTRCDIVVCGRSSSGSKVYDVPSRALGNRALAKVSGDFARWALLERVRAAGLLSRSGGSHWSMLSSVRTSPLPDELVREGELVEVSIEGSPKRYFALPSFLEYHHTRFDGRVRILAPLDPLLWDRDLVQKLFDFEYVWEVYKPADQRKWGWYVCPLLWRDQLIGRIDAAVKERRLVVRRLWVEREIDRALIGEALARHAEALGVEYQGFEYQG
jgi:uncharacterized protein YcaQ